MKPEKRAEQKRLQQARSGVPWRKWGPYLSERQWGTVREDYSESGDAWNFFPHDHARSRAYHWGEDGLAGFSDDAQNLCFALALWNGRDPILKERLFGLTNPQGNHGEDVKEYYFYLDSTPTHSYMKYLYKYPQREYPYQGLLDVNAGRSRYEFEYELLNTGIFDDQAYFDVFVEYAKTSPEDILVRISATNRGSKPAALHLLPTLWFRNEWTWWPESPRPSLRALPQKRGGPVVAAQHDRLGERYLYVDGEIPLLFTENETNLQRLQGTPNVTPYVKDGINDFVVHDRVDAVNPARVGTKVAVHYESVIKPGKSVQLRLRLSDRAPEHSFAPFADFDGQFEARLQEADEFYESIQPPDQTEDQRRMMRQAMAGMLWSKQLYFYDMGKWLEEHGVDPMQPKREIRNSAWGHMVNHDVISMPDKWEYPWYAVWDLAFHTIALAPADLDFAKQQLDLVLRESYMHPNSQIPAYEWNFGDVNPPVQAWAALFLYRLGQAIQGDTDVLFLKRAFLKLDGNFTWWLNRKDRFGKNVFEGGFLGLDNIGVFDRSAPLPTGGCLEQADATAWMSLFCQSMLEMSVELAAYDPAFRDVGNKFLEYFLLVGNAINQVGDEGMWDEEDGFYYDLLRLPDGRSTRLKVRSMVGLLPLCASTVVEPWQRESMPGMIAYWKDRVRRMPSLTRGIHPMGAGHFGYGDRGLLALLDRPKLERVLARMLDENEFLAPYGIRSISRYHLDHPYTYKMGDQEFTVKYTPAESDSGMFGGNSNWRGPIWFPINALIVRALLNLYMYYGDSLRVECPAGSGKRMNLYEVAQEITTRLSKIFLRDESGKRPVYGGEAMFQNDPHWRDLILFYEYFHGDNGAGLGAGHQTGWTGVIATLMTYFGRISAERCLELGKIGAPNGRRQVA